MPPTSLPPQKLCHWWAGHATPAGTILVVRGPNKGWSRPLLPDHGELAAAGTTRGPAGDARLEAHPPSPDLTV